MCRAGISLDSVKEAVHDDFRQQAGAWRASLAGMDACRAAGLEFQVHTTVTTYNVDGVMAITDLAVARGAKAHHLFFLVPTGRGKDLAAIISPQQYRELLTRILRRQSEVPIELKPVCAPQFIPLARQMGVTTRFTRGCLAGLSYCCILPNGDVHPCPYFPETVGNVRTTAFSTLWREHPLFQELRSGGYTGRCGACDDKSSCGGCRARAYAATGDYMAADTVIC